jgi:hypothetical protein
VPKTKSVLISFIMTTVVLAGAYIGSVLIGAPSRGAVLSPVTAAVSGCALLYAFFKSDRSLKVNRALLLFAAGCFAWMVIGSFLDRLPESKGGAIAEYLCFIGVYRRKCYDRNRRPLYRLQPLLQMAAGQKFCRSFGYGHLQHPVYLDYLL